MRNTILVILMSLMVAGHTVTSHAQSNQSAPLNGPVKGPVFTDYGPVYKVEDRDEPLPKGHHYKVVFDVDESPEDAASLNKRIESVARFINMHAMNGVPLNHMDIAVVLHGKATRNALSHSAYHRRYNVDNPSLDLITQLAEKGVRFYLCGQSARFNGIDKKELAQPIKLSLSAMTMLVVLQGQGYQLLP